MRNVRPYNSNSGIYPDAVYSHIVQGTGSSQTSIQYWFFYYANNFSDFHESDWEMTEVILDNNLTPSICAYSNHDNGAWRRWDQVEGSGSHPLVYVANGSHANYFDANGAKWVVPLASWDHVDKNGRILPLHDVRVLSDQPQSINDTTFGWLGFQGNWGEQNESRLWCNPSQGRSGPIGPAAQADKWQTPLSWAKGLSCDGCQPNPTDLLLKAHSPVNINIYDSLGRHVGKNANGGIDEQILGSEYLDYPEIGQTTIIIHDGDINDNFRIEVDGNGTGPAELELFAPDHHGGLIDYLDYKSIQVNPATKISATLDPSKNYLLRIDTNGDGTNVSQKAPDTTITNSVDFTPPAQVSNLAAVGSSSGSADLTFTAPGDDGNVGTATSYDLRYSTSAITDQYWKDAIPAGNLPTPLTAGSTQTITVSGLNSGTIYYFALKATDKVNLTSPLSNVIIANTTIPQLSWAKKRIYWASWADYQNRQLSIDYKLSNKGTGIAIAATIAASYGNPTSVYVTTLLPLTVGDIGPNSASAVTLKYYVPTSVSSFTTTTYANCKDDANRIYWFPGPMT